MNKAETCPCCHQKIRKLNPHRMCKQKVALLELIAHANDWVTVQHGYGVVVNGKPVRAPYRAEAHASRLAWFGLVEHGPTRSGLYKVTTEGIAFLRGLHMVPAVIWCKDGVVVERDSVMVSVGSVKNVVLDKEYWDNYGQYQKDS